MDWLNMLAIAGMNGGGSGSGGGVSPEEVTTIVKEQFPGGVGYEEVQTVNEPLNITWDGNTEGLVRAEGEMPLFKVSDVVLTDEQVKLVNVTLADFTYSMADEWDTWVENGFVTEDIVMPEGVAFVRKDGAEHMGMMFPEAGIYAFSGGAYVHAITTTEPIEQTKVVTKKLDAKYLPESHQFGTEVVEVYGDTLTWDGNTEGLTCVDVWVGGLYLISDCVPTQAECSGNVWVEYDKSGEIMEGHIARLGEDFLEDGFLADQNYGIFIVPNDNYTSSVLGVTFPKKGTYFSSLASDGESLRTISFTIEGYTDFKTVTTIVRKLDEKYLPDGVGGGIKYVTILEDDNGNYTASATYDEITNWIVGGVEVKCVLYGLMLSLTYSDVLRDISLMGAAARIHMFTCVDLHLLSSSPQCVEVRFEEDGGIWFDAHPLNAAQ